MSGKFHSIVDVELCDLNFVLRESLHRYAIHDGLVKTYLKNKEAGRHGNIKKI